MYMWERKSLTKYLFAVLKAMSGVLLCLLLIFIASMMKEQATKNAYSDFQGFLKEVNVGRYDQQMNKVPPQFELHSLELCSDGARYVSGKQAPYSFRGYTSPRRPTEDMQWYFSGYRDMPLYAILELLGLAGLLPCGLWVVVSRLFLHMNLREFLSGKDWK